MLDSSPRFYSKALEEISLSGQPAFLLGVGAQKAATTWLYKFLSSHPETNMGDLKEYGFWDTVLLTCPTGRKEKYEKELQGLLTSGPQWSIDGPTGNRSRRIQGLSEALYLFNHPEKYASFFRQKVEVSSSTRLVGDITPSYALLDSSELKVVKCTIEAQGFVVRPVFILRDPITRLVSSFNMQLRRRPGAGRQMSESSKRARFLRFCAARENIARSSYEKTVRSLDEAFGAYDVKYLFFESLFDQAKIDTLTSFLQISRCDARVNEVINASPKAFSPSKKVVKDLVDSFSSTYSFCRRRFPDEEALDAWKKPVGNWASRWSSPAR